MIFLLKVLIPGKWLLPQEITFQIQREIILATFNPPVKTVRSKLCPCENSFAKQPDGR
jgi:hypothetical protein